MGAGTGAGGSLNGEGRLADKAVTAVIWSAGQRWAVRIAGFVTVLILTRLLSPQDFGIVAIATSLLPITYLLADMGFSTYVIQATEVDQRSLSTAFWFTAGAGVLISAALVGLAPVIAFMFGVPEVQPVVYGLVPPVLLVTLSTVPMALLRRQMKFQKLAVQSISAAFAGQIVAVVLALMGFGVWALIAQTAANQLVSSVLAWVAAKWRPTLEFSTSTFRRMTSFGAKVVGVELIATGRAVVENAIITAALGVTNLGYINVAQRIVQIAQDVTAAAVLPVSTVVFAQVRESVDRLRSAYLRSLGMSYAVIVPVMVILAVAAPVLVPFLFGKQWDASVAPSQVLAVAGIFVLGAMLDNGLFYGSGKPGRWLVYAAGVDVLTVVAAFFSAPHGLVAWAFGFLAVAVVASIVRWPLVAGLVGASWSRIAMVLARALLAGVIGAAGAVAVFEVSRGLWPIATLLITGVALVIAYLLGSWIFLRREIRDMRQIVASRWQRLRQRIRRKPRSDPREGETHLSTGHTGEDL